MKVIKKGTGQKSWAKEYTCTGNGNKGGGCGAVLLVEATDLYHTHHTDYSGHSDTYTTFRCPECRVETDIPSSDFPSTLNIPNSERSKIDRDNY